ncbi:MAG: putative Ig domain-containing protein [Sediminibacterium sp.]
MKYLLLLSCFCFQLVHAQKINFSSAVFQTGDNPQWRIEKLDDKSWKPIDLHDYWEKQGYDNYNGFAWYRIHFMLPSAAKNKAVIKDLLEVFFPGIDDVDITYLNGVEIGRTGRMPEDPKGYKSGGRIKERHYAIASNHAALHYDQDNVLAIRVFDGGGTGGVFGSQQFIRFWDPIDYISMDAYATSFDFKKNAVSKEISFQNSYSGTLKGVLTTTVQWKDSVVKKYNQPIQLPIGKSVVLFNDLPKLDAASVSFVFTESINQQSIAITQEIPYILTPTEKQTPQIHNAKAFGCKPNVPFLLAIAATGVQPMQFEVAGLPKGLTVDVQTGIITGAVANAGTYAIKVTANNRLGKSTQKIDLVIGKDNVIVTPPMGWNSWNCWGLAVSDARVKSSANAMIHSGLANHGWNYMNIDDGWEAEKRTFDGSILANEKFPNMKELGNYLHANGLKFGIYSSPGPTTCGGFLGSYQEEAKDANTYASWGVDYLKYDLCSYRKLYPNQLNLQQLQAPYFKMNDALKASGRNIVYSLCEYGMEDVWKWGHEVGGNVWRTTGDITDTWTSLKTIGFSQEIPASYNSNNYGFGDPDMLIVGYVGWGDNLHLTKLTPSEQYTHISLWSLLSAPLMLGCDLARMDPFTYNLLSNDEVLAIDQDVLGKGPKKIDFSTDVQVWTKDLADGSKAVGIFNLGNQLLEQNIQLKAIGLEGNYAIRDVWRQKNILSTSAVKASIPSHGVLLLNIKKK